MPGAVKVNITDWFFLKDRVVLSYIGLENAQIQLKRSDSIWNYRFLEDYFSSPKKQQVKKQDDIDLDLEKIEIPQRSAETDRWLARGRYDPGSGAPWMLMPTRST